MGSSPFARTLSRDRRVFLRSLFLCPRTEFGQTLRASRFRTPLSLRDISRGRMETSVAVSVARTFFRDRGVFPGLFFYACGSCLEKRFIQVLRKRGRRCGRGRHGRPWPCEWDVGREPDRDERSEPPTAAPPPGAIQTPEKCKTIMTIRPFVFRVGTTPRPQS